MSVNKVVDTDGGEPLNPVLADPADTNSGAPEGPFSYPDDRSVNGTRRKRPAPDRNRPQGPQPNLNDNEYSLLVGVILLAAFGEKEPEGVFAELLTATLGFDNTTELREWRTSVRDKKLSVDQAIDTLDLGKVDFEKAKAFGSVLDMVSSVESRHNYNVVYGGKDTVKYNGQERQITDMTIREVLDWQKQQARNGAFSAAAGRYQFIRSTLLETCQNNGISLDEKFDEHMQDRLAAIKLEDRGYQEYLNGEMSEAQFMKRLSQEWASMPKDMNGASYYAKDGVNKALIRPETVLATLRQAKQDYIATRSAPLETETSVAAKPASKLTGTYNETVAMGGVAEKPVATETATKPQGELTQAFAQNAAQKVENAGALTTLPADKTEAFKVAANEATAPATTTAEPTTLNIALRLPAQQSAA